MRDGAECLYDQPLGSEAAVGQFWSAPAAELGLPLLAAVYEYGFHHGIRWSGEQISAVAAEVDRLEAHWSASGLSADALANLQERAGFVRQALSIAAQASGWVVIT